MSSPRTVLFVLPLVLTPPLVTPVRAGAQEDDLIWGRVQTVTGEVHEGFIRWDRNEGAWADLLNGYKETSPVVFVDWWELAHPGDTSRERVIEVAGYRITWDDDVPDFSSSHESGIRFGHIRSLTPTGDDQARVELRSGRVVELEGGSTDLGTELREILVSGGPGKVARLQWEELERMELMAPPPEARAAGRRLHGTVQVRDGPRFTGYLSWNSDAAFTSDTLKGFGSRSGGEGILFRRVASIRSLEDGVRITLDDGSEVAPPERIAADWGNPRIQISDPALGMVEVEWDAVEEVRFHPPAISTEWEDFDGGHRLRGTVVTTDSTELTGWIRWDADEEYSWEILDGRDGPLTFDVEFGRVAAIQRTVRLSVGVSADVTGAEVQEHRRDGARVTLRDGRTFNLDGSNDVNGDNEGILVLEDGSGTSPDDPEASWVMVRWTDFMAARFEGEGGS
jgi:hypothetical protein